MIFLVSNDNKTWKRGLTSQFYASKCLTLENVKHNFFNRFCQTLQMYSCFDFLFLLFILTFEALVSYVPLQVRGCPGRQSWLVACTVRIET